MAQPPVPGRVPGGEPGREARLAAFAQGGAGDAGRPGPELAAVVSELSGPQGRCAGASDDELIGLLGRWAALESWAAAGKLAAVRELIRRRALPGPRGCGDLPGAWEEGLGHEVAAELAVSLRAADALAGLAWDLQARLPGIGAMLAAGTISLAAARVISGELSVLDDERAAQAEALVIGQLAGKTPGQIQKLAARAVVSVDPDGARRRREQAEREEARVRFWRDHTGASALAAYGLPTDAALAANENISQRAEAYKKAKIRPDARMDQLRVLAFLDILNGVSGAARIARSRAGDDDGSASDDPDDDHPRDGDARDDGDADRDPDNDDGPGNGQGGGPVLPARANLTIPLATLLGLAERPGEAHGLGPLDPALARDLAAAAAASPRSQWCVTVTDTSGVAVGHGCARPARTRRANPPPPGSRDGPWAFTPRAGPGPPGGFGSWALTMPGGQELTVKLGPVPVTDCDHRHQSHGYQPGDTLRHLVQIRDGECTFPPCSRQARESDFEHATPYDKGGKTCACNAGARSRRCHRVKQSSGWSLTQPRPGWHQWTTPGGRTYTQGPMRYPA